MARLIRVFGPDGGGKSTITPAVCDQLNGLVIQGSRPASWPDKTWHRECGTSEASADPGYHLETLRRCYGMVGRLLVSREVDTIILDSDPQCTIAAKAHVMVDARIPLDDMFHALGSVKGEFVAPSIQQTGVHVTVGGPRAARGQLLYDRIKDRDEASAHDPQSPEVAGALAIAYDSLEEMLSAQDILCARIETNGEYELQHTLRSITQVAHPPEL